MKFGLQRRWLSLFVAFCLLLCAVPVFAVTAETAATESGVELFIRPGRESGYGALYLSAAESAPSGTDHSTHRYYPLEGEGSITIDGVAASADYCLNKYGTDSNGGKWVFYSTKTDAANLLTVGQTVTISGKFACSEDPSYVIEFAEVHFQRTGETAYAQVESAGGSGEEEEPAGETITLSDFAISDSTVAATATAIIGIYDAGIDGKTLEMYVTPSTTTSDDGWHSIIYYGTSSKGAWDGFRLAFRDTDNALGVFDYTGESSREGFATRLNRYYLDSGYGIQMGTRFKLGLKLDWVDSDADGLTDDVSLTVYANDTELGTSTLTDMTGLIGNGILFYAEAGNQMVIESAGNESSGDEGGTEAGESDVKLYIRPGRYSKQDNLYLSAVESAACTTDYSTHFQAIDGEGGIYLNGALLKDAYLIKYGADDGYGAGKWVIRMQPMDGVARYIGAGETLTVEGKFQSTYDNTVLDFTEASFRCVAAESKFFTWSEVSSAEHTRVTLSDLGIEAGDYCHVLTSANAATLAGKEILFRLAHTYDSTAATTEGGRLYIGGTSATPRSGLQILWRGDNTLNIYAADGTTRILKKSLSDLGLVQGDVMKVSVSLHYIDADDDGSLDDAALRLYINGTTITDDELVFNDTALGDYIAFYENTGHTLSLSDMVTQQHLSLNDFGLSSGEYGAKNTHTGLSDTSLRGNLFEIDVTRHAGTVEDAENFVFIDYAARNKGNWEGIRVAHRADNVLLVHNLMQGTATYGYPLFDIDMATYGVTIDQKYRLGLQLDYADKDSDGEKDDAVLSVYVNGTRVDGDKAYILNAPTLGNALLIYGNDGDSATYEQVDFVDPNELVNPFVFTLSDMEKSGFDADGNLVLYLKPTTGILGNPNEAVYATPAMTVGGTAVSGLTMLKTNFGSFKLVIPAAQVPTGNFPVSFTAGEILRSDAGNTMTLRADQTLYVNQYGVSLSAYVECAGENVEMTYNSSIAASSVNNKGIYVLSTDNMPVDTSWGTAIYPADDGVSGVIVNGTLHRIALKKYHEDGYYVCLQDYGYFAAAGDTVMIYGRYVLDNQYVEFEPLLLQWDDTTWATLDGGATIPSMSADASDIPLVLSNVASIDGVAKNGVATLSEPGTHTVVYGYGDVSLSQSITVYRPNDVDEDNRYSVLDAVQLKRGVAANGTDGGELALANGNLATLRGIVLGATKADDRLPTGTIGETGTGSYITSVNKTQNGTTVFSMADTDNGYVSTGDFDAYGYDYVIDLNVDRDVKILHLSDPQIIDSTQQRDPDRLGTAGTAEYAPDRMDVMLFDQMREVIARTQPDLILITGDLVYGEFDDAGTSFEILINFMEEQKILWAPIYGNHCNETAKGVAWQSEQLANAEYCVFNRRHEIGGNGNYSIGIANNGELQRTVYMFDSNACYGTDDPEVWHRVGMGATQIAWYRAMALRTNEIAGKVIPSFMAWHIPTTEFLDAAQAACYQGASDNVTYTIGVDNVAQPGDFGYKGEVFKSAWDAGNLHSIMLEVGTDAMFCGHSHCNNVSIAYGGVRWTFALKIGFYDREAPTQGGTLIELDGEDFAIQQIVVSE